MSVFYTQSERTDKKYPIEMALDFAHRYLKSRRGNASLCLNCINGRSRTEKVTVAELNEIIEKVIIETMSFK